MHTAPDQNYRNKISGPLLDRIDIHVEVPAVRYQELASIGTEEPSAAIRERVLAARQIQQKRFKGLRKVHCNAAMRPKEIQKHCVLKPEAQDMLPPLPRLRRAGKMAITELHFSAPPSSRYPPERRDRDYGWQAGPTTAF